MQFTISQYTDWRHNKERQAYNAISMSLYRAIAQCIVAESEKKDTENKVYKLQKRTGSSEDSFAAIIKSSPMYASR